jgi:hypothetical protein
LKLPGPQFLQFCNGAALTTTYPHDVGLTGRNHIKSLPLFVKAFSLDHCKGRNAARQLCGVRSNNNMRLCPQENAFNLLSTHLASLDTSITSVATTKTLSGTSLDLFDFLLNGCLTTYLNFRSRRDACNDVDVQLLPYPLLSAIEDSVSDDLTTIVS